MSEEKKSGWFSKLKEAGKLSLAKEVAKFACKNFVPGGGIIADAIDGYDQIQDEKFKEKLETILETIAATDGDILGLAQNIAADNDAARIEILSKFPGMEDRLNGLGLEFKSKITDLEELLKRDFESLREGQQKIIGRIEEESKQTRKKVDELKDEISQKMDQFQNQMKQFLKARSMASKASMADSLSIRTADEKKMVREFLGRLREFPKDKIAGSTLADLGRLFGAIGESDEALKLNQEALEKASTDLEKATAHYNNFVTWLEKSEYEKALEEYKAAVSTRDGRAEFKLFPSGKYTPLKILGAGGFGVAFLCREATGREAVVKALLELSDERAVISEAGVLQQVDSPYIVRITDYGYADWNTKKGPYLGMRYFPGQDMEIWIKEKGAFSEERGLEIAGALALGMKAAHQKNIFHRDLKPANILYREMGEKFELKIIDFGLALRGAALADQQKSLAGKSDRSIIEQEIAGTLKYAPPEQMGEIQKPVGPWSDIYSYGMTLNEIFFGHFQPSRRDVRNYPNQDLVELIEDCTEYEPKNRPQSFDEVLERLSDVSTAGQRTVSTQEESRRKTQEEEAHIKAEEEERRRKEEEARRRVEEERQSKLAEEQRRRAEKEKRQREEETRKKAEEERRQQEEEERKKREQKTIIEVEGHKIAIPGAFRFLKKATYSVPVTSGGFLGFGGTPISHTVQEYLHEPTGMEFVLVLGGSFQMGDTNWDDSQPVHTVTVKPFLMGKYQVTQKVWQKIMGNNPSKFKGDDRPVEQVSWNDCQEFCKKTGLFLPTEVQWEAACRAETKTEYYWGDSDSEIGNYAWYDGNLGNETHEVGQKKPNAFGLYDMSGNVWEWCQDWYDSGDYPSGTTDPKGPSSGSYRVRRGGSYLDDPDLCVSGFRYGGSPDDRGNLGFRVSQACL